MEFTTNLELQSQATRLIENKLDTHAIGMNGAITLHGTSFQKTLPIFRDNIISSDYNSYDFQSELFPLHSPLLRESWLVSFPPPSYMLKFSGYSCLIRDLENNFTLLKLRTCYIDKITLLTACAEDQCFIMLRMIWKCMLYISNMPIYFIILTVVIYKYSNRHTPKGSARCVQNFDDSLDFAIRITYRISLRSSSIKEPRHPLLKVFFIISLLISLKTVGR